MDKPRIGFVGIGLMGHGIAKNLVTKGYPLTVRAAPQPRGRWTTCSPRARRKSATYAELARASDIVFLCVTGAPQVEEVDVRRRRHRERRARRA